MIEKYIGEFSPVTFSDIGRYRNGGALKLATQAKSFRRGERSRDLIYGIDKIHRLLPDFQIPISHSILNPKSSILNFTPPQAL